MDCYASRSICLDLSQLFVVSDADTLADCPFVGHMPGAWHCWYAVIGSKAQSPVRGLLKIPSTNLHMNVNLLVVETELTSPTKEQFQIMYDFTRNRIPFL